MNQNSICVVSVKHAWSLKHGSRYEFIYFFINVVLTLMGSTVFFLFLILILIAMESKAILCLIWARHEPQPAPKRAAVYPKVHGYLEDHKAGERACYSALHPPQYTSVQEKPI